MHVFFSSLSFLRSDYVNYPRYHKGRGDFWFEKRLRRGGEKKYTGSLEGGAMESDRRKTPSPKKSNKNPNLHIEKYIPPIPFKT